MNNSRFEPGICRPRPSFRLQTLSSVRAWGKPEGFLGQLLGQYMAAYSDELNQWAVSTLNIQAGEKILEIGFGPGVAIEEMVYHTQASYIAGIDYSELMVTKAKTRNKDAIQAGRVHLLHGDVTQLPPLETVFDKILSINNFMYWPQPVHSLKQLRAILKPGGVMSIVFERKASQVDNGDWDDQVEYFGRCLLQAGFTDIQGAFHPINIERYGKSCIVAGILLQGRNPVA